MQASLECVPCFVRQAVEALTLGTNDEALQQRVLRRLLGDLATGDWDASAPEISQRLHRIIRQETGSADPYREIKRRMNRIAIELLPRCREWVGSCADPFEATVRLAALGNLMDSGAKTQIDPEEMPSLLSTLGGKPMRGATSALQVMAREARQILYLTDNAGEIVFDRLLIEALPMEKVTVATRGSAVLNDALEEDAALAGIASLVPVIGNGSDAPGTVIADCSDSFREAFGRADLIISKGQGNYETLSEESAPLFFLFAVKCPLVSRQIGVPSGWLVAEPTAHWTGRFVMGKGRRG